MNNGDVAIKDLKKNENLWQTQKQKPTHIFIKTLFYYKVGKIVNFLNQISDLDFYPGKH